MFTALGGHNAVAEVLIKNKADVNLISDDGQSALMWAYSKSSLIFFKIIYFAGDLSVSHQYMNSWEGSFLLTRILDI